MVQHMDEHDPNRSYDFEEGELETMLLEYWRVQCVDLQTVDVKKYKTFFQRNVRLHVLSIVKIE